MAIGDVYSETDADGYYGTTVIKNISYAGGIVGKNGSNGTTVNCYRSGSQSVSGDVIDTSGLAATEKDLQSKKLYTELLRWSDSIWKISSGGYPTLK